MRILDRDDGFAVISIKEPWKAAREGYSDNIPSNEPISKESIKVYYEKVHRKYGIDSEEGMRQYIRAILGKAS